MFEASPLEATFEERAPAGLGGRWYGVYPAQVVDVRDPDKQGRVKITLPWARDPKGERYEAWARVATLMAGDKRGSFFIPDADDEVLVAFEGGDPRRPFVVGALWNGKDAPPEPMDGGGRNDKKVLKSRSGVTITLSDESGREKLTLETPKGQKVVLDDGAGSIELEDANGNSVTLSSSGITLSSSGTVSIAASTLDVSAGTMSVSGTSRFSGPLNADTAIIQSVVGTSYTPGAGNVW